MQMGWTWVYLSVMLVLMGLIANNFSYIHHVICHRITDKEMPRIITLQKLVVNVILLVYITLVECNKRKTSWNCLQPDRFELDSKFQGQDQSEMKNGLLGFGIWVLGFGWVEYVILGQSDATLGNLKSSQTTKSFRPSNWVSTETKLRKSSSLVNTSQTRTY